MAHTTEYAKGRKDAQLTSLLEGKQLRGEGEYECILGEGNIRRLTQGGFIREHAHVKTCLYRKRPFFYSMALCLLVIC